MNEDVLQHFGVKGMKWGVRKKKDQLNSKDRIIKKGTSIQNISGKKLTDDRHMYASYTSFDKDSYVTVMNFMYGDKIYKNEFTVKKDIKIPSDKKLVDEFTAIAKKNPKAVAEDMAKAYNYVHKFSKKNAKYYENKLSKIDENYSKKGEKITKDFIKLMVSDDASRTRAQFFGALIKKGYDGMSDVNDRDGGAQDPLIIFNTSKNLKTNKSVKLTADELQKYYEKVSFDQEFQKQSKNLKEIQHKHGVMQLNETLQHHGVKGQKWGVIRKRNLSAKSSTPKKPSRVKKEIDSIKREKSWNKILKDVNNMSTKEIQAHANRAQLENEYKRLVKKSDISSKKDKADYLRRDKMSEQELRRKVTRLRAKDSLNRSAKEATKTQRAFAKKVADKAAPLAIKYALKGSISKEDIMDTFINPKSSADRAKKDFLNSVYGTKKERK